jgi:DNA polymerase III epsilon subunit-like protein
MNFVIIDLEFNNTKGLEKYFPELMEREEIAANTECPNEVIQIGAIKLDKNLKLIDSFDAYVKLVVYKIFNPEIKKLTGIRDEDLEEGVNFIDLIELLGAFIDEDSILCSWAKDDITEIIRNCNYHKYYDIHWIKEYIDLQEYFTKVLGLKEALGLKKALKRFNIRHEEEKLHNALYDAVCTGEVFKKLYNPRVLKPYIMKDVYNTPVIYIADYENLKVDENKMNICCPKCKSTVELEIPFEQHKWKFRSFGQCSCCNSKLEVEIAIRKNLKGEHVYANSERIISESKYSELYYRYKYIS